MLQAVAPPRAIPARNSAQFSDAPVHRLRRRNGTELPPKAAQNKWLAHMVLNDGWKDTDYCSVRAVQAEFGLDAVRSPDERTADRCTAQPTAGYWALRYGKVDWGVLLLRD